VPNHECITTYKITEVVQISKNEKAITINLLGKYSSEIFKLVTKKKDLEKYIIKFHLIILILSMIYGAVTGSFIGGTQILINAIKIPIVIFSLIYISLPVFYVFNLFVKKKLEFSQALLVLLIGFTLTTLVMIAFAPVVLLFSLTTSGVNFIVLLNSAVGALALLCGLSYIYLIFRGSYNKSYEYGSLIIFYFIIIFSAPQLLWALRPYFHHISGFIEPMKSNFYIEIINVAVQEPVLTGALIFIFGIVAILIIFNLEENNIIPKPPQKKMEDDGRFIKPDEVIKPDDNISMRFQNQQPTPRPYPYYYHYPYWYYYRPYYR
jgi:hypothetical protein